MLNKLIDKLKQIKLSISWKCVPKEKEPLVVKQQERVRVGPICRA